MDFLKQWAHGDSPEHFKWWTLQLLHALLFVIVFCIVVENKGLSGVIIGCDVLLFNFGDGFCGIDDGDGIGEFNIEYGVEIGDGDGIGDFIMAWDIIGVEIDDWVICILIGLKILLITIGDTSIGVGSGVGRCFSM